MANKTSTSSSISARDKDKTKVEKKNSKWVAEGIEGQLTAILEKQFSSPETHAIVDAIMLSGK